MSERSIRLYLLQLDAEGLTELKSRRAGRALRRHINARRRHLACALIACLAGNEGRRRTGAGLGRIGDRAICCRNIAGSYICPGRVIFGFDI